MKRLTDWTEDELSAEIAAWSRGGSGARLAPEWAHLALQEQSRRLENAETVPPQSSSSTDE